MMSTRYRVFWTLLLLGPPIGGTATALLLILTAMRQGVAKIDEPGLWAAMIIVGMGAGMGYVLGAMPALITAIAAIKLKLKPTMTTLPAAAALGATSTFIMSLLAGLFTLSKLEPLTAAAVRLLTTSLGLTLIGAFATAVCWLLLIRMERKVDRAALRQPDGQTGR